MSPRIFLSLLAALSTGFALAGCAAYSSGMGPDALSLSEAEPVTWSDGAPAVAIQCREPRGCGQRAVSAEAIAAAEEDDAPGLPWVIVRCG